MTEATSGAITEVTLMVTSGVIITEMIMIPVIILIQAANSAGVFATTDWSAWPALRRLAPLARPVSRPSG
ncbi:MAG: hypothetical protein AAB073_01120, partial [Pseudomonadota bacterium]